jgi:hypothetical protein
MNHRFCDGAESEYNMLSLYYIASAALSTAPAPRTSAGLGRRALLAPAAAALTLPLIPKAAQAEPSLTTDTDSRYGVSFGLPEGWTAAVNQLGDGRRLVIATDPKDESTNVFIAFTPIRPDYSSLGSFGTIDYVANTVLPQCGDLSYACSFSRGDDIDANMLSKDTIKGNYNYDYTIQQKGGPKRHLRSLFTVQADGGASLLVGLTAQCLEPSYAELAPMFKSVLASYKGKA